MREGRLIQFSQRRGGVLQGVYWISNHMKWCKRIDTLRLSQKLKNCSTRVDSVIEIYEMNHISCIIFGNILSEGFGSSSANVGSSRVTSGIFVGYRATFGIPRSNFAMMHSMQIQKIVCRTSDRDQLD